MVLCEPLTLILHQYGVKSKKATANSNNKQPTTILISTNPPIQKRERQLSYDTPTIFILVSRRNNTSHPMRFDFMRVVVVSGPWRPDHYVLLYLLLTDQSD